MDTCPDHLLLSQQLCIALHGLLHLHHSKWRYCLLFALEPVLWLHTSTVRLEGMQFPVWPEYLHHNVRLLILPYHCSGHQSCSQFSSVERPDSPCMYLADKHCDCSGSYNGLCMCSCQTLTLWRLCPLLPPSCLSRTLQLAGQQLLLLGAIPVSPLAGPTSGVQHVLSVWHCTALSCSVLYGIAPAAHWGKPECLKLPVVSMFRPKTELHCALDWLLTPCMSCPTL